MRCPGCSLEIESGEMRYTGRLPEELWHAHCWSDKRGDLSHTNLSDLRAKMASSLDNLESTFDRLKRAIERIP